MTHDRVMRFVPVFDTPIQATCFAAHQALVWLGRPEHAPQPSPQAPE